MDRIVKAKVESLKEFVNKEEEEEDQRRKE